MCRASGLVLKRLSAFSGQQVSQRTQASRIGQGFTAATHGGLTRQHQFSDLSGPDEAPRHLVRHRIEQSHMHATLLVLQTPGTCMTGHGEQGRQRTQGDMHRKKQHSQ